MIIARLAALNLILLALWFVWGERYPLVVAGTSTLIILIMLHQYRQLSKFNKSILVKLEEGLSHLQDGNFSVSLADESSPSNQALIELFNTTSDKIRKERQFLYQRELLLDKMMNSANVAMVIVDHRGTVSFANHTTEQVFGAEVALNGSNWNAVLEQAYPRLNEELATHQGALVNIESSDKTANIWHVFSEHISLHGLPNTLYMFKPVTEELTRQELKTWKEVIRVISHELNNSIAPISTMCHNGKLLASRLDEPHLDRVFNTISSRINHLSEFVRNYSDLAKQYTPNKSTVNVTQLLENLNPLYPFTQVDSFACDNISADAGQLEQVFINLLKNAQEASSQGQGHGHGHGHVEVSVSNLDNNRILITIEDNGPGIPPAMLNEVMLPFRSTKQAGTGIGLSVCKEIIDSHQGQLVLKNQVTGTGLRVEVILPKG